MMDTNESVRLHVHWIVKVLAIIPGVFSSYYAFFYLFGAYRDGQAIYLLYGLYFLSIVLISLYIIIISETKIDVDNEGLIATCPPYATYAMKWEEVNSYKTFAISTVFYGDEKAFKYSLFLAGKGRKQFKEYITQQIASRQIEEYKPTGITRIAEWKMIYRSNVNRRITAKRKFVANFAQEYIEERIDVVLNKFGYVPIECEKHIYKRESSRLKNMISFSPKNREVEASIYTIEEETYHTLVNVTYTIDATGQLFLSSKEREYWENEIESFESLVCRKEVGSFDIDHEAQEVSRHNWITAIILIGLPILTLVFISVLGKSSSSSSFSQFIYLILGVVISLIFAISITKSRLNASA